MKTVGVIGGMGPKATIDFLKKVVSLTAAKNDQDHIKMIVYMNPQIPDRTEAICGKGESPLGALISSAKLLENAGVDFIVIPCVTAHYWLKKIQDSVTRPVTNLVEITLNKIKRMKICPRNIGILATTGVIQAKIFNKLFKSEGFNIIEPNNEIQDDCVMKGIYAIKRGEASEQTKQFFVYACNHLAARGADVIVGACTEIPLAISDGDIQIPLIDVNEALAEETVRQTHKPN